MTDIPPTLINEAAESELVSAAIQEPENFTKLKADFSPAELAALAPRTVYEIALRMDAEGATIDPLSITYVLRRELLDDPGFYGKCQDVITSNPSPSLYPQHAKDVWDSIARRAARAAIDTAREAVLDPRDRNWQSKVDVLQELPKGERRQASFPLVLAGDLKPSLETSDFVEGVFTDGGASVVYGPSNVGKSFWMLDLAAHVATGRAWRFGEHEVDQGGVVYVALEGDHGVKNRIEALKREGILTEGAPLFLIFSPVSLLEPGHAGMLSESVASAALESGLPVKLVVIDTLSRAMAGGNENAPEAMTAVVASIDAVRSKTGAHVAIIHHCGKNEALGSRGHSSLRAAIDTEIELHRPEDENTITARFTKQRELPQGEPMPFSLRVVVLGMNTRGKEVASCIVAQQDSVMASERLSKRGRKAVATQDQILGLLPCPKTTDWQKKALADLGVSKSAFYRLYQGLAGRFVPQCGSSPVSPIPKECGTNGTSADTAGPEMYFGTNGTNGTNGSAEMTGSQERGGAPQ